MLALALALAVASPAQAATRTPAKPHGVTVASVSSSSFTVVAARSSFATKYRMYASNTKSTLALARIRSVRHTAASSTPRLTLSTLPLTTAPYYYRVQAINGSKVRYSDVYSVSLRPATPSGLRATGSRATGLSLTWGGGTAARYVVTQATNATLTAGRRTYTTSSQAHQFTPDGLRRGTTYYFRVRAANGSTWSGYSGLAHAVAPSAGQGVRVLTYNLLRAGSTGKASGDGIVAPWSQRRGAAVRLINRANPDVIALQEASDWTGAVKGPRQVDDLRSALGTGTYALARTEIPPSEAHYFRTGRYILYKSATFEAAGAGGYWTIGSKRYAAYQELRSRVTGARFLVVSVHLESGNGRTVDARREAQTKALLTKVSSYTSRTHVPVVYAGDFNSHQGRSVVYDGPGQTFRAAHHVDGDEVAQTVVNQRFNSANQYRRTAPATGDHVDHVFAPPGVAVRRWELMLDLSGGRFVGTIPSDHNPIAADVVFPY